MALQDRQLKGGKWYTFFLFVYFLLAFYVYLVKQGTLTEVEGSVPLTSFYYLF
jgi:hypothetical protein